MEKRAFEETGLIPRSIIRTFDRFKKQLLPGAETLVIQEFRISRYQVLVSVKCLIALLTIPLITNYIAKSIFLTPVTEYLWNTKQNDIFLNSYQENRALNEIQKFQEKIYFESLLEENEKMNFFIQNKKDLKNIPVSSSSEMMISGRASSLLMSSSRMMNDAPKAPQELIIIRENDEELLASEARKLEIVSEASLQPEIIEFVSSQDKVKLDFQKFFQQKTLELSTEYNKESIQAITNLFGDFITFSTISFLFIWLKPQIIILKSFLTESIYSLSDTTKSFLLILFTDLLVGFHSPKGWEFFIECVLRHFGLPENQDFILLFVATFPVLLDTVFKYWIFRYLNKISPSTVATYHNMIE